MSNIAVNTPPLEHGGQLNKIAKQYNVPLEQWLDLSTGIAPLSYPVPPIPAEVWQKLPQPSQALHKAASDYYQTDNLLAIPGSQVIIQHLPQVAAIQGYTHSRIWLPEIGYQEHHKAWKTTDCTLMFYQNINELILQLQPQDIVVLINPNNPSGKGYTNDQVAQLLGHVEQQKGLLIIDEAFMDCTPQHSFIRYTASSRLIVLRSIGKFFGLAGLRLGFVAASGSWLKLFNTLLGPWSINGPAQYIGQQALTDTAWQTQQHKFLNTQSRQLANLLKMTFKQPPKGTALFQTVHYEKAEVLFEQLCQQGIYVRLCDEKNALRFGIPNQTNYLRLKTALESICLKTKSHNRHPS